MIQAELTLILELQTDEWWQRRDGADAGKREEAYSLAGKAHRESSGGSLIYTDFEDLMGDEQDVVIAWLYSAG